AVSGRFYPAQPAALIEALDGFLQPAQQSTAVCVLVPHAGDMYFGHVAGAVYSQIHLPPRVIGLCPNHTGYGVPLSIMKSGAWQTPLGLMQIDEELCTALMSTDTHLQDDIEAHRFEHALEVQLPFLQRISGSSLRFVPITLGTGNLQ